jgi:hypothetical protein
MLGGPHNMLGALLVSLGFHPGGKFFGSKSGLNQKKSEKHGKNKGKS